MAFNRIGYGQVEPNQLSGIKTGQIYASLPLDKKVEVLQNGEFMFYDYANNMVIADPADLDNGEIVMTEPYLVYNEVKIYEDWLSYKDFAMIRVGNNYVTNPAAVRRVTSANADGSVYGDGALTKDAEIEHGDLQGGYRMDGIAPRLVKTNVGDIFTTNMVKTGVEYNVGTILSPVLNPTTHTLQLEESSAGPIKFAVVKVYTMPDGQDGLKVQRIA